MNPVEKAVWFIEAQFARDICLDEVARVAGVSRYHMARAFAEATGQSVMRYARGRRLTEAARSLAAGAPDILAIALDARYGSHEAFTRAFRDQFGVTPESVRAARRLDNLTLVEPIRMENTRTMNLEPPRFVDGKAPLIAGLGVRYTFQTIQGIPAQWQRFGPHIGHIAAQVGRTAYGVCCDFDDDDSFQYIAGVEVSRFGDLPDGFSTVRMSPRAGTRCSAIAITSPRSARPTSRSGARGGPNPGTRWPTPRTSSGMGRNSTPGRGTVWWRSGCRSRRETRSMTRAISRRDMLIAMGVAMSSTASTPFAWRPITTADAGVAADLGDRVDAAQRNGELLGLHGLLVARRGRLALERYYPGADETWGRPLGQVAFGPDTPHDLRSVTKSLVGLLYGLALADGKVPPPDAVLIDQFPEYPDLAADPARRRLTVAHALTMTMGLEWNENLPYTSPANSEIAMERAPDRYRFVLERPIAEAPGQRWGYNGGATALLGRIIARGVGAALPDYAETVLFAPLGITPFEWIRGQDGAPSAASGLRLKPRDLLRIGQLIVQGGRWDGRPVVPPAWLEASFRAAVTIDGPVRYGRHWYLGEAAVAAKSGQRFEPWIGAFGNGGQRLLVMPGLELAVAIIAGNYNQPGQGQMPLRLWRDIVLPSLIIE